MVRKLFLSLIGLLLIFSQANLNAFQADTKNIPSDKYFETALNEINSAKSSINLVMYLISIIPDQPDSGPSQLVGALIKAKTRGVQVKVILDQNIDFEEESRADVIYQNKNQQAYELLKRNNIPVFFDEADVYTHAKAIVIDDETIYSYSNNLGNELKKSCKCYLYDLGIRNAIVKDFSSLRDRSDKGILYESFVFLKLKNALRPNMEIKFWRTKDGDEVDFILLKDRKPLPIEVKSALHDFEIPKGLKRFLLRYPKTRRALVVNENKSGVVSYGDCSIRFVTFDMFGLEEDFHNPEK